jgi:hypothetical protein
MVWMNIDDFVCITSNWMMNLQSLADRPHHHQKAIAPPFPKNQLPQNTCVKSTFALMLINTGF